MASGRRAGQGTTGGGRYRACRPLDPAADRSLHEMLRIVDQEFGDAERVVELTLPDERPGGGDRGAAFHQRGDRASS